MARDDYHVLACIVLAYFYRCLKEGISPNMDDVDDRQLKIPYSYWEYIIRHLQQSGYIDGVTISKYKGGTNISCNSVEITPLGIEFLEENDTMKKAKAVLRDAGGALKSIVDVLGVLKIIN